MWDNFPEGWDRLPATSMTESKLRDRAQIVALGVALVSLSVVYGFAHLSTSHELATASVSRLMGGTAETPFQYRVLIPFLLGALSHAFPSFEAVLGSVLLVVEVVFHLGSVAMCVAYLRRRGASLTAAAFGALPIAIVPFLYFVVPPFRPFFYPSDTAGCFFLLGCLITASAGRWGWFSALFLIGTFNRETTLLALAAVALTTLRGPRSRPARLAVAGCALGFVAIKAGLFLAYSHNAGAGLFELRHHAVRGSHPSHLLTNLKALASFPRGAYVLGLVIAPIAAAALGARRVRDETLASYCVVVPAYLVVLFGIANLDELRLFGEVVLPFGVALASSELV